MKSLFKLLIAFMIVSGVCLTAALSLSRNLFLDLLQLHGSRITGLPVSANSVSIDWSGRKLEYDGLSINNPRTADTLPLVLVNKVRAQWQPDLQPNFSRPGFIPDVLPVEELALENVRITYDADTEGNNLDDLRKNLSNAASAELLARMNKSSSTDATNLNPSQRFTFRSVRIENIEINTRSKENATRQQIFPLPPVRLDEAGMREGGITLAELSDRVSRILAEGIHREALARGIIEPPRPDPETVQAVASETRPEKKRKKVSRSQDESMSNQQEQESGTADNKAKDTARNVGDAFQRLGRGLKKKLFGSGN